MNHYTDRKAIFRTSVWLEDTLYYKTTVYYNLCLYVNVLSILHSLYELCTLHNWKTSVQSTEHLRDLHNSENQYTVTSNIFSTVWSIFFDTTKFLRIYLTVTKEHLYISVCLVMYEVRYTRLETEKLFHQKQQLEIIKTKKFVIKKYNYYPP